LNIYLIPYTGMRHFVMAWVVGAASVLGWWWVVFFTVKVEPWLYANVGFMLPMWMQGPVFLGTLVAAVTFTSLFAEGALRRRVMRWRVFWAMFGTGVAMGGALFGYSLWQLMMPLTTDEVMDKVVADTSLVTLRFRLNAWLVAGIWSGIGTFLARRVHGFITHRWTWGGRDGEAPAVVPTWPEWFSALFAHLGGGAVAGAFGAVAWHVPGYYDELAGDLYLSSFLGAFTFGLLFGLLSWPLPDDMYAGWIRVLSAERYGLRIPVPHTDGTPAERFIGHFPRGLDLYLPADQGVAELHTSFVVGPDGRYAVRGLTIQPTLVRRPLERIDLRYDPRRPAPLETGLRMEDRIFMGENGETVVEFLMLPREES
jgi:hypothetical protein